MDFAIRGPIVRDDLPGLCDRVCALLRESGDGVVRCDVSRVDVDAVTVDDRFEKPPEAIAREIELLKAMASIWLIHDPAQETLRFGQRRLLDDLFEGYWTSPTMLPQREAWSAAEQTGPSGEDRQLSGVGATTPAKDLAIWRAKARLICDHIAGMTDLYALHVHGEMYRGGTPTSLRLPS